MKNKNILTLILLFVMSFQVVHAFAIDMLDTHECQVNEYVEEFTPSVEVDHSDDVCSICAAFHHSFIIPEYTFIKREILSRELPQAFIKSYNYNPTKNFLKPPRKI